MFEKIKVRCQTRLNFFVITSLIRKKDSIPVPCRRKRNVECVYTNFSDVLMLIENDRGMFEQICNARFFKRRGAMTVQLANKRSGGGNERHASTITAWTSVTSSMAAAVLSTYVTERGTITNRVPCWFTT